MIYSAPLLVKLLQKQNTDRFRQGTFTLPYRAKVGSYPHPNLETIVSAGEPCGYWQVDHKKDYGQLNERREKLPLRGYIPASSIRGIVRAWVKEFETKSIGKMEELLGKQQDDQTIQSGKIIFFDAWSDEPQLIELDMVNPQERFQVFHDSAKQSNPQPLYSLPKVSNLKVAIQGTSKATKEDVDQVWQWLEKALTHNGVGSRTAAGYGRLTASNLPKGIKSGKSVKVLDFTLLSQGCYGVKPPSKENKWQGKPELRPTHWRGWLRSWLLRFFLGVMNEENAQKTLAELMGTIEPEAKKGCVKIEVKGLDQHKVSNSSPSFYQWHGKLIILAPEEVLKTILLPVVKFAVSVGGVGRGWRRPLHIFHKNRDYARGCLLRLTHINEEEKTVSYAMSCNPDQWQEVYNKWKSAVQKRWPDRFLANPPRHDAEVFAPHACAVYLVPGPDTDPLKKESNLYEWKNDQEIKTTGLGMNLIYENKYKHKLDVGGDAGGGKTGCSWVSIRRINVENNRCKEIVCLFLGKANDLRSSFLDDLKKINGTVKLFGQ